MFQDGGLGRNNPIDIVHEEASGLFGSREQIVLSLGTGKVSIATLDRRVDTVANALAKIATKIEREADIFRRRDHFQGSYFRFNVPSSGDKGLIESDVDDLSYLRMMTAIYLDDTKTSQELKACIEKLVETDLSRTQTTTERSKEIAAPPTEPSYMGKDSGYASYSSASVKQVEDNRAEEAFDIMSLKTTSSHVQVGEQDRGAGMDAFARDVVQSLDPDLSAHIEDHQGVLCTIQNALRAFSYSLEGGLRMEESKDRRRAARFIRQEHQ